MKWAVAVMALILSACSTEVQIHQLKGAEKFCANHGGVSRMWSEVSSWHAQCVDGERLYNAGERQ